MTAKTPRTINIFTTIDELTYLELSTIATLSIQQRRTVYRMALMFATTRAAFWDLFSLDPNYASCDHIKIDELLQGMSERIKSWREKENETSG